MKNSKCRNFVPTTSSHAALCFSFQQDFWRPEMDYICNILVFISVIQSSKRFSQVFGPLYILTEMRNLQIFICINLHIYICMTILKSRLNMHIFLCMLSEIWARIREKKHCKHENWREKASLDTLKPPKYLGEASSQLIQLNSIHVYWDKPTANLNGMS